MPAAAALPDSIAVGRTQKLDAAAITPAVATVKQATPAHPDRAGSPDRTKNTAATPAGIAMCHRRSPVRSEWRPTSTIVTAATPQGIVDTRPIVTVSREMVSLTICGSQNVTP